MEKIKDRKYITAKEFNDFSKNQDKLINILNRDMTKLSTDVSWLKKLMGWQIALVGAIAATVIASFIKLVVI